MEPIPDAATAVHSAAGGPAKIRRQRRFDSLHYVQSMDDIVNVVKIVGIEYQHIAHVI